MVDKSFKLTLLVEPLAKPSETQQDSPAADLSESFTIHALT